MTWDFIVGCVLGAGAAMVVTVTAVLAWERRR